MAQFKTARATPRQNGWLFTTKTGIYGTDYSSGPSSPPSAWAPTGPRTPSTRPRRSDADGKPYSGANKYVMHFDKGQMPPADGFWSLTMYDAEYFFVDNPLNKYTVSPRNKLKHNADGSLDIYIQNESPGKDKEANWLPAPKDKFVLMLRLYWPKEKRSRRFSTALEAAGGQKGGLPCAGRAARQ